MSICGCWSEPFIVYLKSPLHFSCIEVQQRKKWIQNDHPILVPQGSPAYHGCSQQKIRVNRQTSPRWDEVWFCLEMNLSLDEV
ncbi:hypothetical protein Q8A67_003176 [Cirrhinus molitorella]|uniref:Uncharacterized protein n=1 Tax=Cirrhinus molitorella TaxID=172907 RepID=A0AA88U4B7_9TELE|nr:hypothetical protein Q8A67_003176 [Cirrhinus molitorella]